MQEHCDRHVQTDAGRAAFERFRSRRELAGRANNVIDRSEPFVEMEQYGYQHQQAPPPVYLQSQPQAQAVQHQSGSPHTQYQQQYQQQSPFQQQQYPIVQPQQQHQHQPQQQQPQQQQPPPLVIGEAHLSRRGPPTMDPALWGPQCSGQPMRGPSASANGIYHC